MKITRAVTDGPLGRQFSQLIAARGRRAIPWSSFRASRYSPDALSLAARNARVVAAGEYGAFALFGAVASGLTLHGAPLDLVSAAAMIPLEEMRHADLFVRLAATCEGRDAREVEIDVDTEALKKRCVPPATLEELDAFMLRLPAINETIAGALLAACEENATDPVARAVYANVLRDEVHHARIGWYYLAWRAPRWSARERQAAADHAALQVMSIARRYRAARPSRPHEDEGRALGVVPPAARREIVLDVMDEEIVPALDALGLGASHVWRTR